MAVLNQQQQLIANALNSGNKPAAGKGDQPKADIYVNIGIPIRKEVDGVEVDYVISLPFGLALDTMNPLAVRGNNEEWKEEATARNELLQALTTLGQSLEPGTGRLMPGLSVQVYRRKEDAPVAASKELSSMILAALNQ